VRRAATNSKTSTRSRITWLAIPGSDLLNAGAAKWLSRKGGRATGTNGKKYALIRRKNSVRSLL